MSQTVAILDALVGRLKGAFEQKLAIELFPENPKNYRLNHPRGAILVAFGSSRFGDPEALDAVFQERNLMLPLTLVFRQLNGRDGVVTYLDAIRDCLTGWYPPHCDNACRPVDEVFTGQVAGLWQYTQRFAARATQLQRMVPGAPGVPGGAIGGALRPPTFEGNP
ncbi:Gp37 family protein [Metapseudomonas otitidis]|uniref:Gp37 family protein n=1 Tax=Metapseudomonas otitidis TaxID=319939 RepID=UPI0024491808|nr:Gp37 family protein [Pseudomonas otitidis]MDG9783705.1 Gp37 family protein [Pseudomonas otitidis]